MSQPIPSGGTFTLTTYLGVFLTEAERVAGPRDKSWTILGIEFFGEEREQAVPHIWYPNGFVAIRLTRDAATDPQKALFQLAHEACHLISPSGSSEASNLEEGFATVVGHTLARKYTNVDWKIDPLYREAHDDVAKLLADNPTAIRDVRTLENRLSSVTPDHLKQAVRGIQAQLAERLCHRWRRRIG
jgi:hypothetical protein